MREEAVSSQLPFYAAAVASARGLPDHAGFNYSPRGLSSPRLLHHPLFLSDPSLFLSVNRPGHIVSNERSDSRDGIREIAPNVASATESKSVRYFFPDLRIAWIDEENHEEILKVCMR